MTNPVEFQGRYEDAGFLRGEGCYTADIAVEGMATVVFVRSPFAHAEITPAPPAGRARRNLCQMRRTATGCLEGCRQLRKFSSDTCRS